MKTAIIILNWNGFDVLKECLESLMRAKGDFFVVVADNASGDASVEKLCRWCESNSVAYKYVAEGREAGVVAGEREVLVYSLTKNYGFAKGNNIAIKLAMQSAPERILLLNNDTEVEPCFLEKLEGFQKANPKYKILTPLIFFGSDRTRIWNAGGKLSFGFRKYYYAGKTRNDIKEHLYIPITFVTGCALYFSPENLNDDCKLLTERFFFGEEDFEFSMSMNRRRIDMACVLDSVVYHKVGASGSNMFALGKVYLHYLNRFIDIRLHKNALFYILWVVVNIPLCLRHFYKASKSVGTAFKLLYRLVADAARKESVGYDDFEALVIKKTYFKKI